ncbi:hypothetical protein D3C80_1351610 [compost metagenome]
MNRQAKLYSNFFTDLAVTRQLQAGNFTLAERFSRRRPALIQRQQINHHLTAFHVVVDCRPAIELQGGATKNHQTVANIAKLYWQSQTSIGQSGILGLLQQWKHFGADRDSLALVG